MPKKKVRSNNKTQTSNKNNTNEEDEIATLNKQIIELTPASGEGLTSNSPKTFLELPLSKHTLLGLEHDSKKTLTEIQSATILHALAGRDILASARTGSGKTLSFLIPLIERLYRNSLVGSICGAIILSPTRELATQIFGVLRTIGKYHTASAGILIGGKKEFYQEQTFLSRTNIIVATPGRLLQHLEQSADFDVSSIEVLVLDEADRILDMGFEFQLERILEYIPRGNNRQTLLFSATQTRKVKDLARLSLKNPEYIFVHSKNSDAHEDDEDGTTANTHIVSSLPPPSLEQLYMVIPLQHKLDLLFSFLKSHIYNNRIIVFFATCSQVQYAHALFCALRPGISILALHGKLKQEKRGFIYQEFLQKECAVLFSTDVASRGLDFPKISWVISFDAPDSREDYIHRVGRTARYQSKGKSLLFLLPSEETLFLKHLLPNITLKKQNLNPKKAFRISTANVAGSILAKYPDYALYAKKAFQSYLRSYSFMPHKDIFDLRVLLDDKNITEEYAYSLGLAAVPSLSFLDSIKDMTRDTRRKQKNENKKLAQLKEEIKADRLLKRNKRKKVEDVEAVVPEEQDDFLSVKQTDPSKDPVPTIENVQPTTTIYEQQRSKKTKKTTFDEEGNEIKHSLEDTSFDKSSLSTQHDSYLKQVQERLAKSKSLDVAQEKDRIRQKRLKVKGKKEESGDGGGGVQLAVSEEESESESEEDSDDDDSDSSSDDDSESNSDSSNTSDSEDSDT